jgi:hypothetical protein
MEDFWSEEGTSFTHWMFIIKRLLVLEKGFTEEEANRIEEEPFREFWDKDYSCEKALNILYPGI